LRQISGDWQAAVRTGSTQRRAQQKIPQEDA
jgi:hypothetical protein